MSIDAEQVQRWLDAYTHAWITYEPDEICALFTAAGTPGTYRPLLVQGDQAIAVRLSSYYTDETQTTLDRAYHNLWVLRFGEEGRCCSFTEWFMEAPGVR